MQKMNESKFTDLVLDVTSDYVAATMFSENDFSLADCVNFIAEATKLDRDDILESFSDLIKNELERASSVRSVGISESTEKFSDTLNEDAAEDVDKQVQQKTNGSNNFKEDDADRRNSIGNNTNLIDRRQFYLYANAQKGQFLICSIDKTLAQKAGDAVSSFAKNLLGLNQTKYINGGTLVSPISQKDAASIISAKKIKYLNLTQNLGDGKQNDDANQMQQQADQLSNQTKNGQQQNNQLQQSGQQQQQNDKAAPQQQADQQDKK